MSSQYGPYAKAYLGYHVMLEVLLTQDSTKSFSLRTGSTTGVLDWIAASGGFCFAIYIVLYLVGEYFSRKLMAAEIADSLYL